MDHITSKNKRTYTKKVKYVNGFYNKLYTFSDNERQQDFLRKCQVYKKYFENYDLFTFDFTNPHKSQFSITQTSVKTQDYNKDIFSWLILYKQLITKLNQFSLPNYFVCLSDVMEENFCFYKNELIFIDESKINLHYDINLAKNECIYGAYAYLCNSPFEYNYKNLSPHYVNEKILEAVEEAYYGIWNT